MLRCGTITHGWLNTGQKRVHYGITDVEEASLSTITEAEWNEQGVYAGDMVFLTVGDATNPQILVQLSDPFGTITKATFA